MDSISSSSMRSSVSDRQSANENIGDKEDLANKLRQIDGRGYKNYLRIKGGYSFGWYQLFLDRIQGDPFASPSKIRIRTSANFSKIPADIISHKTRRIAIQDFITRILHNKIKQMTGKNGGGNNDTKIEYDGDSRGEVEDGKNGTYRITGSGKSGKVSINVGGQEVIERTSVLVTSDLSEARLEVGLPARGRTIISKEAKKIFFDQLPHLANCLLWENLPQERAVEFVNCVENQEHIRSKLEKMGLVAFIADGSILPRKSGISDKQMDNVKEVTRFYSPNSMRVNIEDLPHSPATLQADKRTDYKNDSFQNIYSISGMGIPKGVNIIVGGGYHGKSTVLNAIEKCVYPHVPYDGREYVVTSPDAVKIKAEDRRRVENVDISGFINNLPNGKDTTRFSTDDASGSTSQAANIAEAVEVGARCLLLDEDTCASNFMIRDSKMQTLVSKDKEPITPFVDSVRGLADRRDVSSIIVMGGSGDYFDVADWIIMMDNYVPKDVTSKAKEVSKQFNITEQKEQRVPKTSNRIPIAKSISPKSKHRNDDRVKIKARGAQTIEYGRGEEIVLRSVDQILDSSQTSAIGYSVFFVYQKLADDKTPLWKIMELVDNHFENKELLERLDPLHKSGEHPGNFARPRRHEVAAAINRLRTTKMDA